MYAALGSLKKAGVKNRLGFRAKEVFEFVDDEMQT